MESTFFIYQFEKRLNLSFYLKKFFNLICALLYLDFLSKKDVEPLYKKKNFAYNKS